ncbi:Glycosyltransferase family 69 protein [Mycena venus]|uniref:Glycosyltransferase family 69 protein n=1 Tax=Mycena venus TaxID=2733690 RepID=A0A8H7CEJ3_9AGAR|nr:Glycosyltransferase family 69 protein [Mycena venus]
MLGRPWPPAFPEARALFVTALATVPSWGFCMCIGYLVHSFELDDRGDGADSAPRRTVHRSTKPWREWNVALFPLCLGYFCFAIFGLYLLATYELPTDHRFKADVELANRVQKRSGYGKGEKIFIAAMFYNNAPVIPYWTQEITKLIHYLGPDNVFVSIVESYSSDATPTLLLSFDKALEAMGVPHRILTRDTSIPRPTSMLTAPPRIDFLAATRNLVIEPLVERGGYDRLLFSNDVFVEAEAIVELLHTRDGDYDMACGVDFHNRGNLSKLDCTAGCTTSGSCATGAGHLVSALWPYFLDDPSLHQSMNDEPVSAFTCWNGIVSIRAEPFLPPSLRSTAPGKQLSSAPLTPALPSTHPLYTPPHAGNTAEMTPASAPPLRFRASSSLATGECFSSESFNLPYDLQRVFALSDIYVNPRVITAYQWRFYVWFKYVLRHWVVKRWIERVERGRGVHLAKWVLGDPTEVWRWDGGECHPGPEHVLDGEERIGDESARIDDAGAALEGGALSWLAGDYGGSKAL